MYFYILFWLSDHRDCKSYMCIIVSLLEYRDSIFRIAWWRNSCTCTKPYRSQSMYMEWLYSFSSVCVAYRCRRSAWCTSILLLTTLVTCWHRFPAVSAKLRFHGKLTTVITFEPRIFSSIPILILIPSSSAFCWYLTLAFKVLSLKFMSVIRNLYLVRTAGNWCQQFTSAVRRGQLVHRALHLHLHMYLTTIGTSIPRASDWARDPANNIVGSVAVGTLWQEWVRFRNAGE